MNGHIQITLNGHPVGLKFGYNCVKWHTLDCEQFFDEYYHRDPQGEVTGLTMLGLANLLHAAYRNNQILKREPATIEFEAFYDWVFEKNQTPEGQAEINRVSLEYDNSREVRVFIENMQEQTEEVKKKTQQATSSV